MAAHGKREEPFLYFFLQDTLFILNLKRLIKAFLSVEHDFLATQQFVAVFSDKRLHMRSRKAIAGHVNAELYTPQMAPVKSQGSSANSHRTSDRFTSV